MRNGVYAMLAVVVGVALVGLLPGQLSNLAASTMETASLQGASRGVTDENATFGIYTSKANDTVGAPEADATATESAAAEGSIIIIGFDTSYDPYADLIYYGSWGVGLVVALSVYFVAKRMLG